MVWLANAGIIYVLIWSVLMIKFVIDVSEKKLCFSAKGDMLVFVLYIVLWAPFVFIMGGYTVIKRLIETVRIYKETPTKAERDAAIVARNL